MLLLAKELKLDYEQYGKIADHEFKHYKSHIHLTTINAYLLKTGHVPTGLITINEVSIKPADGTLEFKVVDADGQEYSAFIEVDDFKEFIPLFTLVLTIAPAMVALSDQYHMDFIYNFAGTLAARVAFGELETYPRYVPAILPKHVDNTDYGTEDAQTLFFRFTYIGEQRTATNLLRTPALVRYIVESSDKDLNNGFSEVHPVIMHGTLVEFNGVIQYPHEIIIPVDNDSINEYAKGFGAEFQNTVEVCVAGDACWFDTVAGKTRAL